MPKLEKGDKVNVDFKPAEKETTPPKHYTIETLNNYLKNPFKAEKSMASDDESKSDDDDYRAIFEGLELGTEATRTGIIDNARKSGYIKLTKDVYTILPDGEYLIESLSNMQISMDKYKTAELGKALKKVFHGEITVNDSVQLAKGEIKEVFDKRQVPPEQDKDIGLFREKAGICPLCNHDVIRTKYGYSCTGYKENGCKFQIYMVICGRVIPISAVKQLLETGHTSKLTGFMSKKGTQFDASLKLDNGKAVFDFSK